MLIGDIVRGNAKYYPNRVAVEERGLKLTWAELDARSNRLADSLLQLGMQKGDRLAILSPNTLYYWELCFALAKSGVVGNPLNVRLNAAELGEYIAYTKPRGIVVHPSMLPVAQELFAQGFPFEFKIGLPGVDQLPLQYETLVANGSGVLIEGIGETDIYMLGATSGTTGVAKAAMHTHRTTLAAITNWLSEGIDVRPHDTHLQAVPMFFNSGGPQMLYPFLKAGRGLVLGAQFDPGTFLRTVQEQRVTHTILPPPMLNMVVNHPNVASFDLSSMRCIINGGAPLYPSLLKQGREIFGDVFVPIYGAVESYSTGLILKKEDQVSDGPPGLVRRLGSLGKPMAGMQAKVVADDGMEVCFGSGQAGEICLRGDSLAIGYFENSATTQETFVDGWLHTGDLAQVDEDGFIYFFDRKKDVINTGGMKVYSVEVEQAIASHPAVAAVAVIGVPDAKFGEAIQAVVVLRPEMHATAEEIIEHCRGSLSSFKKPRYLDFVDSLPMNASGKLLKRILREQYQKASNNLSKVATGANTSQVKAQ